MAKRWALISSTESRIKMTNRFDEESVWEPMTLYKDCTSLSVYTLIEDLSSEQDQKEQIQRLSDIMLNPLRSDAINDVDQHRRERGQQHI